MKPRGRTIAGVVLAAGIAISGAPQGGGPAQQQPRPATLHGAWLREVLDLDLIGAVTDYCAIAADQHAPMQDRLVATARLIELRRLGEVPAGTAIDAMLLPVVLRPTFEPSDAPDRAQVESELRAGAAARSATIEYLAANDVPLLRPLVLATVQAVAETADPVRAQRLRRLRWRYLPWSSDPTRLLDRVRANEIVRLELDGDSEAAADLRRQVFPNWTPRAWPSDAEAAWATVRSNLDEWLHEQQLTRYEIELLRRLALALDEAAVDEPAEALRLLDRMPLYAERMRSGLRDRGGERR